MATGQIVHRGYRLSISARLDSEAILLVLRIDKKALDILRL